MVTRRAFLALAGGAGVVAVTAVAGVQLLPGESKPSGDPVIKYGQENCARCRMTISDAKFAAAWRDPSGKEKHFDDIGCMVLAMRDAAPPEGARFWVHDYESEAWLDAATASYAISKGIDSPMAYGIAAAATTQAAQALAARFDGATVAQWGTLGSSFAERG